MNKNQALIKLSLHIMDTRLKPVIDRSRSIERKTIPVNTALYENDYAEYIAAKKGMLIHIDKGV